MASSIRSTSPSCVLTNACAMPEKLAATVFGNTSLAICCTRVSAVPSDTPGARLNETVTEGSWPEWFTVTGPTEYLKCATVLSGTSGPRDDRTQSLPRASTSAWYSGKSSITTQYSFVDV